MNKAGGQASRISGEGSDWPALIADESQALAGRVTGLRRCAAALVLVIPAIACGFAAANVSAAEFQIEEASISDLHRAIRKRQTTCVGVVQAYIDRARAYNGACTKLVTADGGSIAEVAGAVRATRVLQFPTDTVAIDQILPDFDQYQGKPIEYGRMEPTISDPQVHQQFGMVVGMPDAGQLSALSTLNIRGERSVTCQAECDLNPEQGELAPSCPAVCETFRQQPDALETAAALDAEYGRRPDLKKLPMYCVPFSFKDVFDTTDMRTTAGADVDYAMDAPPKDATLVARLRSKGAIIYAKANLAEYNGGAGNPGGDAEVKSKEFGAGSRSTWAGVACNPYDTERETGGSSSGSATSVGANLAMCSLCEETGGSCRQPAWRSAVVGLVTTKGMLGYGGAIGADPYLDRAGIHCKNVGDTAKVLDALQDPEQGYFDPRDVYSALPKRLLPEQPFASFVQSKIKKRGKPLQGLRIGIVREYMVHHTENDKAISDMIDAEIKAVLRDRLGAQLVESKDLEYPDDPEIADMTYTFQQALAEILPMHMPEYLVQKKKDEDTPDGESGDAQAQLQFAVDGLDISHRDYMAKASLGLAPIADELNIRTVTRSPRTASFSFHLAQYLLARDDARIKDWASLNANAKYYEEGRKVAMKNWENKIDIQSAGITQRVKMRDVMRMVVNKVMQQNNIDILVNPTITIPPTRIGHASEPRAKERPTGRFPTSADLGIPEITVPAGFNSIVYEPRFALTEKKDDYESVTNSDEATRLAHPMPVGISFWAGVGEEAMIFKVASAYEAATLHRKPPAAFGPLQKQ